MKGFITITLVLLVSHVANVMGSCSQNADCNCVNAICQDIEGVDYPSLACASDSRCFCDTTTGADGAHECNYSRSPPRDPTNAPTRAPTLVPTNARTLSPSTPPTVAPLTDAPSTSPTISPSNNPTTDAPSPGPTVSPTKTPTNEPTTSTPTTSPSNNPTTDAPSAGPTVSPTKMPTKEPTTSTPTTSPSNDPTTDAPSAGPTISPTKMPTKAPTEIPTTPFPTTKEPTTGPPDNTCGECQGLNDRDCCGWGIWNVWTCQCDCAEGFCLSSNQKCYDGCTTRTAFNPFGGCEPGVDCPWYPSSDGSTHCVSTVNAAGIYSIHRSAELCCGLHFSYLDTDDCVQDSQGSVETAKDKISEKENRPSKFYPDIYGRDNCVFHNGYFDWMMDSDSYLFETESDCCSLWYPARTDCPDMSEPTEGDVDENPYPVQGHFYPHLDESNCRFGRNYPQWMAQELFVQSYLYTTPDECCSTWYPAAGDCPLGPDDGVQVGKYWQSDVHFYPSWKGDWCSVGKNYPEWMADPTKINTHLFDSGIDCCSTWFPDQVVECETNITTDDDEEEEEEAKEWYPTLAWPFACSSDGNIPSWMLMTGFQQYYIFDSHSACCKAHYCATTSSLFT